MTLGEFGRFPGPDEDDDQARAERRRAFFASPWYLLAGSAAMAGLGLAAAIPEPDLWMAWVLVGLGAFGVALALDDLRRRRGTDDA